MKVARTRGKVSGRSGGDIGLSSLFCVGFESADDVEREVVGVLEDPEGFLSTEFQQCGAINVQQNHYY